MRTSALLHLVGAAWLLAPPVAFAQRFPFERTLDVAGPTKLDVSTVRGRIEIVAGMAGRVLVNGDVTVRAGWDVPASAVELARKLANAPPIEHDGNAVRLRTPADDATQRAVTISYRVQVPPNTEVHSVSNSGATSIRGVAAPVDVRTQSAAIVLKDLSGAVRVTTGSGAVSAENVTEGLAVNTTSSSFRGTALGSSLRLQTQSGDVDATFTGKGDVEVETGSSAIRLRGVNGGLTATTESGRLTVQGAPRRDWVATTGSSSVTFEIEPGIGVSIDAVSRSGDVVVDGAVQGSIGKHAVNGSVSGGGPTVRVSSGSGSIRIQIGSR